MSRERLHLLSAVLGSKELDFYLATKTSDIRWLTGFSHVFDEEQAHQALTSFGNSDFVDNKFIPYLFTDRRYSEALRTLNAQGIWQILDESRPRFAFVVEQLLASLPSVANAAWGRSATVRVAVDSDLRLDWYKALKKALDETKETAFSFELVETSNLLGELRATKDEREIESLKAAQAITDAAFDHMLGFLRPGITEKEAAFELEFFMRKAGADSVAFPSIVAGGPNSAIPHAKPGERVLCKGDLVLMDFGARLNDYCSDMTRTVVLGRASDQQRAMYAATLAAQSAVISALKPGMSGAEAQRIADTVIAEHGFEGKLIHSLGHGVGIDVHELPTLAPKVETELKVGNVVTVEPGVYLEGVGGVRIEDFGVIGEDGFEAFTQSTHEMIEL
jgi:Xaa-Pro aminopeptidase